MVSNKTKKFWSDVIYLFNFFIMNSERIKNLALRVDTIIWESYLKKLLSQGSILACCLWENLNNVRIFSVGKYNFSGDKRRGIYCTYTVKKGRFCGVQSLILWKCYLISTYSTRWNSCSFPCTNMRKGPLTLFSNSVWCILQPHERASEKHIHIFRPRGV